MLLSELEDYVRALRLHADTRGEQDPEVTFSVHRNHASALLNTSKQYMDVQPAAIRDSLLRYTGGAGENSYRFILPMETVDIGR